jgi:NAD(P)-dependent dehydrogenase (short-subunit alcohol dehydrogenase family)
MKGWAWAMNTGTLTKNQGEDGLMGTLTGRVAFVTGAGSGIGRASAIALAAEGAIVFATDIDAPGGRDTAAMIEQAGGQAAFRAQDVVEEARWAELVKRVMDLYGRLDILVNNAGIGTSGLITDVTLDQWNHQMAVNVTSCFLGTKHALPAMRSPRPDGHVGGSIINISSVAGLGGSAGMSAYCASKGAVRLLTKAVAMECAAARDGIRCNSVHPGIIDTAIWQKLDTSGVLSAAMTGTAQPGANSLDVDMVGAGAPVGFAGRPEDIAAGVVFLASDASRYMTGSELVIDGGWTAH